MAWNDAPPTKDELQASNVSWDSTPPTKAELGTAGVDDNSISTGKAAKLGAVSGAALGLRPFASGVGAAAGGAKGAYETSRNQGKGVGESLKDAYKEAKEDFLQARDDANKEQDAASSAHPLAYYGSAIAGGLAPAAALPAGSLGAAAATGAGLGAANALSSANTAGDAAKDVAGGALTGAAFHGIGTAISKGLGLFKTSAKPTMDDLVQAGQRLKIDPTPGMTNASPVVQGMESSLSQSPSLAGALVRDPVNKVRAGLKVAADEVLEGAKGDYSRIQTGRDALKNITSNLAERYNNVQMAYQPFNEELPKMFPELEDKFKLADQIAGAGQNNLSLNSDMGQFAKKVSNAVMSSNSLADFENVRKQVGGALNAAYRTGDRNAIDAVSSMQDKLADFTDDQFVKLAQTARPGMVGTKMGQDMVQEYQNAKQTYSQMRQDMQPLLDTLGIKNKNAKAAIEAVQDLPDEKVASSLFNTNKISTLEKMQKMFPEQFENFRKAKLLEIQNNSLDNHGELDPAKLVRNADKLDPHVQQVIFGPNAQKLNDIRTFVRAFPDKMGPSGTPQGELFNQSWNPGLQATELGRYGIYKAMSSPGPQGLIRPAANAISSGQGKTLLQLPARGLILNNSQRSQ